MCVENAFHVQCVRVRRYCESGDFLRLFVQNDSEVICSFFSLHTKLSTFRMFTNLIFPFSYTIQFYQKDDFPLSFASSLKPF